MRWTSAALASVLLISWHGSAQAQPIGLQPEQLPTLSVRIEDEPDAPTWTYSPSLDAFSPAEDPDRGYVFESPGGMTILGGRAHIEIEELAFDLNPFVLNNIMVTNMTALTQVFTVGVSLPTTFPAPNVVSGTATASIVDGDDGGATLASVGGQAIYSALIDFVAIETLHDDPFALSVGPGGSDGAVDSFGPDVNLIPVTNSIGIELRFSLTPADTASIVSRFDVVPEPSSLGLVGIGALMLLRRTRKSK